MSKTIDIRVPAIGDFVKIPVIEVLVAEGDALEAEQSLITLESDKATMEVPAPSDGVLTSLTVKVGDELSEGDVIGTMTVGEAEAEAESAAEPEPEAPPQSAPKPDPKPAAAKAAEPAAGQAATPSKPYSDMGPGAGGLLPASPGVRKLAREMGIDLATIQGTGRNGRITDDDLHQQLKQRLSGGGGAALPGLAAAPQVDFSQFGAVEHEPLSRIQKISGPALHRNWVSIPHVTQFDEADITDMEAFRQASKREAEHAGARLTPLVFMIKAVVASLKAFPRFNASLSADGATLIFKRYFHIGVAVDTPGGLVVPVVRDCDQKGLMALAVELAELSARARDGKLKADEMKGGCFTISSLGGIGGTQFTPIINAPELAILGVSKAELRPQWDGQAFQPRLMLPVALSYDHRVIDGAQAVRFTQHLCQQLTDLRRLLL
jgi:pyruvate dehydrogenase E2 component (dihydrolipoamide acetyltransferase)